MLRTPSMLSRRVNWGHPLSAGLISYGVCGPSPSVEDLATPSTNADQKSRALEFPGPGEPETGIYPDVRVTEMGYAVEPGSDKFLLSTYLPPGHPVRAINGEVTLEVLCKPTGLASGAYQHIVDATIYVTYLNGPALLIDNTGKVYAIGYGYSSGYTSVTATTAAGAVVDNVWYHLVAVLSVKRGFAKVYINAVEKATVSDASDWGTKATGKTINYHIGAWGYTSDRRPFYGQIAYWRIWNRPLEQYEIRELYVDPHDMLAKPSRMWLHSTGTTFNPAWAHGSNVILQAGVGA